MSYSIHAYLIRKDLNYDELWAFKSIRTLFEKSSRVDFFETQNPFTKQNILKLKIDGVYSISTFFEKGDIVASDLKLITGLDAAIPSRIRFLFGPDATNQYDDIAVIILTFLEQLEEVIVYSPNQNKVIFKNC